MRHAPVQKVEAVAALLARCPEYQGRLQFRLVCPPPEPGIVAYDATRRTLEHRIAQINTAWGTDTWRPIDYLPYSLSSTDLMDQYLAADIFWVASLQDGMNLTVKEFIAAQAAVGLCGAVVLSRYVGAASQLGGAALLTDPNSPANLVDTLQQALDLTPDERHARMKQLADLLGHHQPREWASQIIAAIKGAVEARAPGRSERRVCPAWLHAAELPGP
jgi:trehalose-6-phosphate synthase